MWVGSQRHAPAALPREWPGIHCVEHGWHLGTVWAGAENLAPTGIRSPDCPARSESPYRLNYPGPISMNLAAKTWCIMCTPRAGSIYVHAHYKVAEMSSLAGVYISDFFPCAGKWKLFARCIIAEIYSRIEYQAVQAWCGVSVAAIWLGKKPAS